jgi:hypothetical protein
VQVEQLGQQFGVVHVEAVRGVLVTARAGVDADLGLLVGGESVEHGVVQLDETPQYTLGRIELEREATLGEVQLDGRRTAVEALPDIGLGLIGEVLQEGFPRVPDDSLGRVQQAQRGRGDHCLLDRPAGDLASLVEV